MVHLFWLDDPAVGIAQRTAGFYCKPRWQPPAWTTVGTSSRLWPTTGKLKRGDRRGKSKLSERLFQDLEMILDRQLKVIVRASSNLHKSPGVFWRDLLLWRQALLKPGTRFSAVTLLLSRTSYP